MTSASWELSRSQSGGDLANWRTNSPTAIPGVGGAMDLAVGAKHVYVVMDLFTKTGECKLVQECSYPLTGADCVERVYTDVAVFALAGREVRVLEIFDGSLDELRASTGLVLIDATTSQN